jgi:hypothetical protein
MTASPQAKRHHLNEVTTRYGNIEGYFDRVWELIMPVNSICESGSWIRDSKEKYRREKCCLRITKFRELS